LQILFFSKITTGRSAPELSGDYTIAAAMTRLLEGSGLTFRQVNEHTVEVRQAPPHSGRLPRNAHPPPNTFANESISNVTHMWLAPEGLFNADPNEYMLRTMDATLTGELDWFAMR
jgi:hypothetical protein